jgi:glycosyltransferase involved in cell wall biosynthesis
VTLLTHYYAPEVGAPQTRLRATASLLRDLGHEVRIVTGPPHYPTGVVQSGYRALSVTRERIDRVPVLRLPVLTRPNRGFVDRVVDQGAFAFSAAAAIGSIRNTDVVIVESPPLFLGLTARFYRALADRPFIFHVADPWPDFPIAMGALRGRLPIRAGRWLESRAYAGASLITTVTPALVARLDAHPDARGKVRLLENGVDLDRFLPDLDPAEARRRLGWEEARLTLAYVGTVGLAQGVGTLIDAVCGLADAGVVLHIVGDGTDRTALEADALQRGLRNVQFHASVPAEEVPMRLAAADALVVMLKRGPLYDESLPTKLVEAFAAGRPLVVSAAGGPARMVSESTSGFVAAPEDPEALREAIVRCLDTKDRAVIGASARATAASYDRRVIVKKLDSYLWEARRSSPG